MYKIIFYKDAEGNSYIEKYIQELAEKRNKNKDSRIKFTKITAYIDMLSRKGLNLGEPYVKHLKDEIWELRPIRDRILFAYYDNNKFILLHYFMKKTRRTPKKEIEQAKNNLREYIKERESNERRVDMGRSEKKT